MEKSEVSTNFRICNSRKRVLTCFLVFFFPVIILSVIFQVSVINFVMFVAIIIITFMENLLYL